VGENTHIDIYPNNYVDFKYVYLQIILWKKILQDIIVVQMYEIVNMHFQWNYLTF